MGVLATMPFAAGAIGYLAGGFIGDRLFPGRRHHLIVLCLAASALTTYTAAAVASGGVSVAAMTASFLLLGVGLSTLLTMPLLLAPDGLAGTAYGIANTAAQIAGFLSPFMIGMILDASGQDFAAALDAVVVLLIAGAASASRIGDAPQQTNILMPPAVAGPPLLNAAVRRTTP